MRPFAVVLAIMLALCGVGYAVSRARAGSPPPPSEMPREDALEVLLLQAQIAGLAREAQPLYTRLAELANKHQLHVLPNGQLDAVVDSKGHITRQPQSPQPAPK